MDRKSQCAEAKSEEGKGGNGDGEEATPSERDIGVAENVTEHGQDASVENEEPNGVDDTGSVNSTSFGPSFSIDNASTVQPSSETSASAGGSVSAEELDSLDMDDASAEAIQAEYQFLLDLSLVCLQSETTDSPSQTRTSPAKRVELTDDEAINRIRRHYPTLSRDHARHIANALANGPEAFQKWCMDAMNQEGSTEGKAFKAFWKLRQDRTRYSCKKCGKLGKGCGCPNWCKKCEKPRKECPCKNNCRKHQVPRSVCGCKNKRRKRVNAKEEHQSSSKKKRLKDPPPPSNEEEDNPDDDDDDDKKEEADRKPAAK